MDSPRFALILLVVAANTATACSGSYSPPTTPTSATPPPAPVAAPLPPSPHTLTGVVYEAAETGRVAIEGVEVYCDSCGSPVGHTFAYTGRDGSYSFSWTYNGVVPLLVKKEGYSVLGAVRTFPDGTGQRSATVIGDTVFDIELVRR